MSTILVVEDEAVVARDIQRTLHALGYEVPGTASTGESALQMCEEIAPDLVLMDITLKGQIDGIETAARLHEHGDPALIYLTAHSDEATFERAKQTAPDGYVIKPFSERDLRIAVELALRKHQTGQSLAEQRKLERRLALSERLASVGTVAASIAHELNNPLAAVVGNVGFAAERVSQLRLALQTMAGNERTVSELGELHDALGDAATAAERARTIVSDIKKFARVGELDKQPLRVQEVLESALKLMENQLRHHAEVTRAFRTTPLVDANEGQLVQVFTNLLANAAQAITEGAAADNQIVVSTRTDALGRAVIEVRDTGCGIAEADLPHIFEAFFSTKSEVEGMGIGLSICHSVVTSLGGELTVESERGQGSTFAVSLPPAARPERTVPPPARASRAQRPARVLVIDDDPFVGKVMMRVLGNEHEVWVETDAQQALARLSSGETFDVIFCDMMMPNTSGVDVHTAVHALDPELARRMVFLTGGSFSARAQQFLASVPNPTVVKPFTVDGLRAIVRDRLS